MAETLFGYDQVLNLNKQEGTALHLLSLIAAQTKKAFSMGWEAKNLGKLGAAIANSDAYRSALCKIRAAERCQDDIQY